MLNSFFGNTQVQYIVPSVVLRLPAVIPSFFFADNKVFLFIPFLVASSSISLEETSLSAPKYSLIKAMATSNFFRPLPSFPASSSSTVCHMDRHTQILCLLIFQNQWNLLPPQDLIYLAP